MPFIAIAYAAPLSEPYSFCADSALQSDGWCGLLEDEVRYLRILDEVGVLKPAFRVILPVDPLPPPPDNGPWFWRSPLHDNWQDGRPVTLAPYLRGWTHDELSEYLRPPLPDWLEPQVRIVKGAESAPMPTLSSEESGVELAREVVYYGSWQRLDLWAVNAAWTTSYLTDPRRFAGSLAAYHSHRASERDHALSLRHGNARPLTLLHEMLADRWLEALDLMALLRASLTGSQVNDSDARPTVQMYETLGSDLKQHLATCSAWQAFDLTLGILYLQRLVELHGYARQAGASEVAKEVRSFLIAGMQFCALRFGTAERESYQLVDGPPMRYLKFPMRSITRPYLHAAEEVVRTHSRDLTQQITQDYPGIGFTSSELDDFLAFLEAEALQAWTLELGDLLQLMGEGLDEVPLRRFRLLKSLAMQIDPIALTLAESTGKTGLGGNIARDVAKRVRKSFFDSTRDDWRGQVGKELDQWWRKQTQGRPISVNGLQDLLTQAEQTEEPVVRVGRSILCCRMLRNLGAHQSDKEWRALDFWH